jgi:N-acetylmuramoyl-L-alanine amidase
MIKCPSPNFNNRTLEIEVDILVLHYTGMPTANEALDRMCDPAAEVSAHYMIDEDGQVYQLVPEDKRAWHAGISSWRGNHNINDRSIGIELVNPGHEFGYRAFPDIQIDALIQLIKKILSRYPIPARNVVGHSDIAPTRKQDPGEYFNWSQLASHNIGVWPTANASDNLNQITNLNFGENLEKFGYEITDLTSATLAFQHHFLPSFSTRQADLKTNQCLENLLKSI